MALAGVIAIALVLTEVGRWREWLGSWPETQYHVGIGFVLVLPVAVGGAAWFGAYSVRSGLTDLARLAGRRPLLVASREIGETVGWAWIGYVVGAAPAYTATSFLAVNGHPDPLPVLAQACAVSGAVSVGFWIGTSWPTRVIAPIAGTLVYVVLGFLSFQAEDALIVLTPIDARSMTFHRVVGWALLLQALAWVLVLVQAVARRAAHRRTAFGCLLAAGIVVTPLLLTTPGTQVVDESTVRVACRGLGDDRLCLTRGDEILRDALVRELGAAAAGLDGLLPHRAAFVDDEAAGASRAAGIAVESAVQEASADRFEPVLLSELGGLGNPQLVRSEFHHALVSALVAPSQGVESGTTGTPADLIQSWYLQSVDVAADGSAAPGAVDLDALDFSKRRAERAWLEGLSAARRAAWFTRHREEIANGVLGWDAFRDDGAGQ